MRFSYDLRRIEARFPSRRRSVFSTRFFDTILTLRRRGIKRQRAIYALKMSRATISRGPPLSDMCSCQTSSTTHVCHIAVTLKKVYAVNHFREAHKRAMPKRGVLVALFRRSGPLTLTDQPHVHRAQCFDATEPRGDRCLYIHSVHTVTRLPDDPLFASRCPRKSSPVILFRFKSSNMLYASFRSLRRLIRNSKLESAVFYGIFNI